MAAVRASAGALNGSVAGKSWFNCHPKSHVEPTFAEPRPEDVRSVSLSGSDTVAVKFTRPPAVVNTSGPTVTVGN